MRRSPFLQNVSDHVMRRRYAKRTIETRLHWIKRFILFHLKRHPEIMGNAEVEAFLDYLVLMEAVRLRVKDVDSDYCCIRVWNGKGERHRTVTLAPELKAELHTHMLQMGGDAVQSPFSRVTACPKGLQARYRP